MPISYDLKYGQQGVAVEGCSRRRGYALYGRHKKIPDMPIPANLSHGPVGYIGPRNLILEQLQLLMQLATFLLIMMCSLLQSYLKRKKSNGLGCVGYLMLNYKELNVRGFVYNQRTRDQVLNSLNKS